MEQNVCIYMSQLAEKMRKAGKDSRADLYRVLYNRLHRFPKGGTLTFVGVTAAFVDDFAQSLHDEGLAVNTVNSYVGGFRALYNRAGRTGVFEMPEKSPFAHLRLRREITAKRALSSQAVCELAQMQPSTSTGLRRSLDYFLFCFMACGMPFVDLAHLTRDNIVGKDIVYHRQKTGVRVQVSITPGMRMIIKRYARSDSRYLFPILPEDGGSRSYYKYQLVRYNADLKIIGNYLRHPVALTSYVARHTWATEALRQNTPIAIISQALGHTSEQSTRFYLDSLDQSIMKRANRKITKVVDNLVTGRA